MIRVVTLDSYEKKPIDKMCQMLYAAFGVGCEHSGEVSIPAGFEEPFDAQKLIEALPAMGAFTDDKVLFLTSRKLKTRELLSGSAPTQGFALYTKGRAIVSTNGLKAMEETPKTVVRHAMQQLGHTWELHHCLDPRCAMYPYWTPSYVQGDAIFCNFCRDKSEQKIRLAKS